MAGLKGDFSKLSKLVKSLQKAASPELRRVINKSLAEKTLDLIQYGFSHSVSPYGDAWPPPVLRTSNRSVKPLINTGNLKNSFTVTFRNSGFSVQTAVSYAATHQYGAEIRPTKGRFLRFQGVQTNVTTRGKIKSSQGSGEWIFAKSVTIPRRSMVPDENRGFPKRWHDAFLRLVRKLFKDILQ